MTDPVRLASFETHHLDKALRLSRAVGWPHRSADWRLNLSLGRGVVALKGEEMVGVAVVSFFGATHATVNLVIVAPGQRGAGLGRRLMRQALDFCEGREIRLVATREGLPLYETLGFAATGPVIQHQAAVVVPPSPSAVEWAHADDLPAILDLDRRATGLDRAAFFASAPDIGRLAVLRHDGAVAGFGALRDFGRGAVVGPLAARDADTARALTAFLLAARPGEHLRVDTAEPEALSPLLAALGLPRTGAYVAMTRRAAGVAARRDDGLRSYALASHALG